MKKKASTQEKIKFWTKKLQTYRKRYQKLVKQSPGRWWHDEFFDIQLRVLEEQIASAKHQITELKKSLKS